VQQETKDHNVNVKAAGAKGVLISRQVCVTPEDAKEWEKHLVEPISQRETCTTKVLPLLGDKQKMSFTCPSGQTTAEAAFQRRSGETAYTAVTLTFTPFRNKCGQSIPVPGQSARWLGSDCGSVKSGEVTKCKSGETACAYQSGSGDFSCK
jgi:hypothetical protein